MCSWKINLFLAEKQNYKLSIVIQHVNWINREWHFYPSFMLLTACVILIILTLIKGIHKLGKWAENIKAILCCLKFEPKSSLTLLCSTVKHLIIPKVDVSYCIERMCVESLIVAWYTWLVLILFPSQQTVDGGAAV